MTKIKIFTNKIKTFFQKEIYSIDTANVNPAYRFFINLYRVITFAITDFFKDDCTIRAASLTYLVTLSFIPALIVGLFVLRIFNIYQNIFILIFDWMEKNAPFYEPMVRQILNIADNTDLASFGIIGVISTLISASLILHNIQKSLIKIWRVKIRTSIPRVAVNYIALLILIPVSIGISFTLITYSSIALYYLPAIVRILISWVTPVIAMSLLVLFSYVLVPQTKVNWSNALISSVLVAIAIITLFSVYFKLNINVKNYKQIFDSDKYKTEYIVREVNLLNNKNELADIKLDRISYRIIEDEGTGISAATYEREVISSNALFFTNFAPNIYEQVRKYNFQLDDIVTITSENSLLTSIEPAELSSASAFAQIPVLLLLLYIVWIIILFGAELTYSLQYFRSYGVDVTNIKLSFAEKEMIALEFMHTITYRFINNKKCMSMYDLARDLRVAPSVLNDIADSLEEAQYIVKIVNGSTTSYTLACPPEHITIGDILYKLKMTGGFRAKHFNRNDKYKNIIYQNKAISAKDYNTTLLALVESKKK
ncbi:YhjD/YihY/BrkB family envelope integrity protein [Brachyspira pilosicoli]|uniref:YhjD/YihY/BrkB family envelope integrity protein n=1 Tax=Brachyspira pilosicoli TaxID=52584 RepID=UPI000C788129|nr:YhjD/YihY/BrkB family envelope integrity protein [Brachyspira pilosicoli]PLV64613.1 ribonuclease BN [Brachyspira pilosicoli SP16]